VNVYEGSSPIGYNCSGSSPLTCEVNTNVAAGTTLTFGFQAYNPPAGSYQLQVSTSSDPVVVNSPSFKTTDTAYAHANGFMADGA
jgi:hypothetical protein